MQENFEQIFQKANQKLEQGLNKKEVLALWPEYSGELEPILDIILTLKTLPKKAAPEPAMRRKYILAPSRKFWLGWLHISRFATVSTGAMLLGALILGTGYKASQSAPGEILFGFKKAAEHLQVQLEPNQAEKINLQVGIAQKRLNDAQLALTDSQNDPAKESAALAELSAETTSSINALDRASKETDSSSSSRTGHPLAVSLVNIAEVASKQQTLVQNLSDHNQFNQSAKNALQTTQDSITKVAEIQKSMEAASNDNGLTKLIANPTAVTASGTISSISNNLLTVGENTFILDDKTIIKNSDNNKINKINLAAKQEVLVAGDNTSTGLVARQIILLEKPVAVEVKVLGAIVSITNASSTKATSTQDSNQDPNTVEDPNTASASFFMEDPAPQTNFKH